MSSFDGNAQQLVSWRWVDGTTIDENNVTQTVTIPEGSGSGEADGSWSAEDVVLLDAATTDYDLDALTRDLFGGTITAIEFSRIIAIQVTVASDSVGSIIVGDAAANTWLGPFGAATDTVTVQPGSAATITAFGDGWTVAPTNKVLRLEATGGDATYSIALIGNIA